MNRLPPKRSESARAGCMVPSDEPRLDALVA